MSRHSHRPDEYDLERSHELERRIERDLEREPFRARARKPRHRPHCFSGLMFRPATAPQSPAEQTRRAS